MKTCNRHILIFILTFIFVLIVGLFIHELGHGITVELLGGDFTELYIFPGLQIWPNLGVTYNGDRNGYVAKVRYEFPVDWEANCWEVGFVLFMGSGLNLLASIIALSSLYIIRPVRWFRFFLIAESLMFFDILFYTFLPKFHLKHFIFIGGDIPEPLLGALMLGFSEIEFMILIAIISMLISWSLAIYVKQSIFN